MKHIPFRSTRSSNVLCNTVSLIAMLLAAGSTSAWAAAGNAQNAQIGPGAVIVHSRFGGQIFGFDIDQNGTEGLLTEARTLPDGRTLAAVETFNQATGEITKVVQKVLSKDDFITLGIVGTSVGLVEREHVNNLFVDKRIYRMLNPLSAHVFTDTWTPPFTKDDIITSVTRVQGTDTTLFLYFENGADDRVSVLASNVAANTFGIDMQIPGRPFVLANSPSLAYDYVKNRAVVAASEAEVGGPPPLIALIDLDSGNVSVFPGIQGPFPFRQGMINGLAVDSEDGIAVTTTEVDFAVQFYDLETQTGFSQKMPGATGQLQSGSDVQYDPIHKLFFVAQEVSSTGPGSSIQVYDIHGNLVESLDGFDFSNRSAVIFAHIALNPANRSGYIDGPSDRLGQLQSFTY